MKDDPGGGSTAQEQHFRMCLCVGRMVSKWSCGRTLKGQICGPGQHDSCLFCSPSFMEHSKDTVEEHYVLDTKQRDRDYAEYFTLCNHFLQSCSTYHWLVMNIQSSKLYNWTTDCVSSWGPGLGLDLFFSYGNVVQADAWTSGNVTCSFTNGLKTSQSADSSC